MCCVQVMSFTPAVYSPSTDASDPAMLIDMDMLPDIECGQPIPDFCVLFTDNVFDSDDSEVDPVTRPCFLTPLTPDDDRVYMYKAKIHEVFDGVVPDYEYAHSSSRMFGKRCSKFRYPSFEFWRKQYDMCRFNIITLTGNDDYNQWVDDYVLTENIEMKYLCPHKTRSRHATDRCRVRPVCCDAYNRSCCWVDMSVSFHGSNGILSCATIGANAPVPSFDVSCASLHPITRMREYFHCGTSFGYPVADCKQIDERAIHELSIAFNLLHRFAKQLPAIWVEIMLMLNPYEKMIFASMMHDGNGIDDYVHQLRCNRLYGFNLKAHEHSNYDGHKEIDANSNQSLSRMMNNRRKSPCQHLMRCGGAYDLTNMLNRHAIHTEIVSEWRYLLCDMGRIMLHHLRFHCPENELCWTMCSHNEKLRYVDTWRAVLRYLKVMSYPFHEPTKHSLQLMMYELDDIIRHFVDSDGLFSYLMSNNSVIRLSSCADISDITWMAWEEACDVRTLMNLKDWNSGFRTLLCHTFSFLEVDMHAISEIVDIGIINSSLESDMLPNGNYCEWRGRLGTIVAPIFRFWQMYN